MADTERPRAPAIEPAERALYAELEAFAVDLARAAGAMIEASLDQEILVDYKDAGTDLAPPADAVTSMDHEVEHALAAQLAARYPGHAILGEEGTSTAPAGGEFTWAIDPIDGTQNFVNGLPIYSSSVGVLRRGAPVAGAVWGASSHRLRPGVYHASVGGALCFEGMPVEVARPSQGKRRGLGAMPHDEDHHLRPEAGTGGIGRNTSLPWDRRHIGSGALEAAFLAAGVLDSAFNTGPRVWDIAAGAMLVIAGGRGVWTRYDEHGWVPLERFVRDEDAPLQDELARWRYPVLMATSEAHARLSL